MTKKIISLCILTFLSGCSIRKKTEHQQKHGKMAIISHGIAIESVPTTYNAKKLAEDVFGVNGGNVGLQNVLFVEKILTNLQNSSLQDMHAISAATAQALEKNLASFAYEKQDLIKYVINYLNQFALHQIHMKKFSKHIHNFAQQMVQLINLECDQIFTDPKKTFYFLAAQNSRKLPTILNFWTTPQGEKILQNRPVTSGVQTQGMIMDMGIMVGTQMGTTIANDEVNTEEKTLTDGMAKASNAIQANIQGFQTKAQQQQTKSLQATMKAFSSAEKASQQQTKEAQLTNQAEQLYLYKNISLQQPQQHYLFGQVQFDQLFELGTMLTPQGAVWKNPFAIGDWEYDPNNNSFWQNQLAPTYTTKTKNGKTTQSSAQAANNSIFTEYFTNKPQYTIAGKITLYKVSYPFFVGIMFNKARWISGDTQGLRKCRMLGIYGKSASDIGVYFAEQYTMTAEQLKKSNSTEPIQTPLQQILEQKVNKKKSIPSATFKNISFEPVTFNFNIETGPTGIAYKIWSADEQEPAQATVISQLDLHMFIYHGIGCICPGAVAEFTLQEPKDLIFDAKAIETYKKEMV